MRKYITFLIILLLAVSTIGSSCATEDKNKQAKKSLRKTEQAIANTKPFLFKLSFIPRNKIGDSKKIELGQIELQGEANINKFLTKNKKIQQIIKQDRVFKFKKKLNKKQIGNQKYLRYLVQINPATLQKLTKQINQVSNSSSISKTQLIKFSNLWSNKKIQLWVHPKSKNIRKITGDELPLIRVNKKTINAEGQLSIIIQDYIQTSNLKKNILVWNLTPSANKKIKRLSKLSSKHLTYSKNKETVKQKVKKPESVNKEMKKEGLEVDRIRNQIESYDF